ncbi:nickel ABC transporter substrate-binding protein [Paenibacillus sp.]|uniref:nickel ABC transporter substrate-binding protein n=1 Tax=Paenibacillus sp. TaxID=58172 RepID=UPI002D45E0C8|nr:nickel ABC transporter substrate-binding protein [Paenibacillus sp.]HZG86885.1 nickel ABC transporter substrate-binding protein [Paenibacillus sp.]
MNRRRMFRAKALLALAFAFAAAGCAAQGDSSEQSAAGSAEGRTAAKTVTLMMHYKSATLDPHNDYLPVRAGIAETLVRLDSDLTLIGWLATQWEAVDDTTWTFRIRDGVTFHDGTPLDAAAAKASLERGMSVSKRLGGLDIASMEADGQTLTIRTTEPNPALPSELVNPYAAIVSVAAEAAMGREAFNLQPIGTGPFRVKRFDPNAELALERYEGYWDGPAKLDGAAVRFNEDGNVRALALQSGEADIAWALPAESIETIQSSDRLRVDSNASLRVHLLLYNQRRPAMKELAVRKALHLLLDRESAANDIMLGHAAPANGPFHPGLPFGSDAPAPAHNIEEAKRLLAEAGYTPDANGMLSKAGERLSLELITYAARPELPLIAQLLQSDAAKAGIDIRIRSAEDVDNYLSENNDWDLATYSNLTAPRGDGGYFLHAALMPGGPLNVGGIDIPELNELVAELDRENDADGRNRLIRQAVDIIGREVPHSYAVYPNLITGVNERVVDWRLGREEYYILDHRMDVK